MLGADDTPYLSSARLYRRDAKKSPECWSQRWPNGLLYVEDSQSCSAEENDQHLTWVCKPHAVRVAKPCRAQAPKGPADPQHSAIKPSPSFLELRGLAVCRDFCG